MNKERVDSGESARSFYGQYIVPFLQRGSFPMSAQAVVWPGPGQVLVEERPLEKPGPGQVQLEAEVSLISPGTERAFLLQLPNTSERYPQYPGYNFVGRIAELGPQVEGWQVGDRVAASAPHASHVCTRANKLLAVPPSLSPEQAAFFNMGAIALQGVRRARIELGESVAVVGQGLIGLLALQWARLQGGVPLLAIDPLESRRALALDCGADEALDPEKDPLENRAQVVIEATGAPEPINSALLCAQPAGRVVLLASTRGETQVNFYRDVHKKGLVLLGAHNGARPREESRPGVWTWEEDGRTVLNLLAHRRLDVAPFISHRFPAAQAPRAYELLKAWDPGLLGVVLQWN